MLIRKEIQINTPYGSKKIRICQGDILDYKDTVNLLTISAYEHSYNPVQGTIIKALFENKGISIRMLSQNPKLDLRDFCGCWISRKLPATDFNPNIKRIGCVELNLVNAKHSPEILLSRIQSFFQVLHLLPLNNTSVRRLVMPLLGTGRQNIEPRLIVVPLISETLNYLRQTPYTDDITFIERNTEKADILDEALTQSYAVWQELKNAVSKSYVKKESLLVFISYSNEDRSIADLLCQKLEKQGISVWYAPRDIHQGNYALAIVQAISSCTHFVTIISRSSMASEHVLNEIDLAFEQLKRGVILLPFRVDDEDLRAEFNYYLKRQQWMEAQKPPVEKRIDEFISKVF